jgi:hypothetical protein
VHGCGPARAAARELEVSTVNVMNTARSAHPALRTLGVGLAGLISVYLIGRGIAEFFTVNYSDPASYRNHWGGPSLAGVFAVHSGPAVLAVLGWTIYLRRRRSTRSGETQ